MNPDRKKVLLVGWDAADWKVIHPLMDAGKMPNLQQLVDHGAMAQLATLHPALSPMLWTSIATGKRPFQHGIHGFTEPTPDGLSVQPVTNLSRRCKAIWNILNQNSLRSIVIGWWPSHPSEPLDGVMVSDHFHRARGPLDKGWPLLPGAVHPPQLADTLADLRLHPDELAGPMVEAFVPSAASIDQTRDRRLATLAAVLCECVSIHSVATWLIEHQSWDFFAVYYDAIDHFSHGFMRYHPPRQEFITEADFGLYHRVVSTAYQFHDQMLGALLRKIADDVTVMLVSDHGFHPDHLRPKAIPPVPAGPAIEHRDFGILAIRGPSIKKDELVYGASVLDVTPTLLTIFGLPIGEDMDGKVLAAAFEQPPPVAVIPSWEDVSGNDGRHPPHTRLDPLAARESLDRLVALGYIDKPGEVPQPVVERTQQDLQFNLGEAYQDAGRHAEAYVIFTKLRAADPDEQRYAVHLFTACQALGLIQKMREIVADLDGRRRRLFEQAQVHLQQLAEMVEERQRGTDTEPPAPTALNEAEREEFAHWRNLSRFQPAVVNYFQAQVLSMEGRHREALACLERVQQAHLARPGLFVQVAELYRKMGQWEQAERSYAQALRVDPDNPHAHLGMCRVAGARRDFEAAAQSAMAAIQRLYHYPMGHFFLGLALAQLKEYRRAADAFRVAISLNPNFPQAHLRLAMLLGQRLHDPAGSAEHRRLFVELRARARRGRMLPVEMPAAVEPGKQRVSTSASAESATVYGGDSPPSDIHDVIVVVSGLPRAGTSMIMQMLVAGGMSVLSDGVRSPDADNPRGYFEYEPVKRLHAASAWLSEARGKAVKIVAPLLRYLPDGLPYRIIFIERHLDEVLASQAQMLAHQCRQTENGPVISRLRQEYARLVESAKATLPPSTLFLERDKVLRDPAAAATAISGFLGGSLATAAMAAQVDPTLHRHIALEQLARQS